MRLKAIEAVRFGRIDGTSLNGLSAGLTVVHGPNESGKSSLTALVRHVLYGYPTAGSTKDAPYLSQDGKRLARLVFAGPEGEWVVERAEGPRGGLATVKTLTGESRPNLLSELTAGVPGGAYRVVYGFGLSEMRQIAELKSQDNLFAQFYAASAGLEVNPADVRESIGASMEGLWKKNGSTPELNRLKAEREAARTRIRVLEAEAETLRADAVRLEAAESELEEARGARAAARERADAMVRAVEEAQRAADAAEEGESEALRLDGEAAAARAEAAAVAVDTAVAEAADTVDAIAEGLSGFQEVQGRVAAEEGRLSALESRLRTTAADTGWSVEAAFAAAGDAGAGAEIDAARERLGRAQARVDVAVSARDAAHAEAAGADAAGAPGEGRAARPWLVPGLVTAGAGVAGAVAGLVISQPGLAVFAALLVVVGAALAAFGQRVSPSRGAVPSRVRLATAEAELTAAVQALEAARATWSDWVSSRGYGDGTEEPSAIAARYQVARTLRTADADRGEIMAALARARQAAEGYAARVRDVIAPLLGESPEAVTLDRIPEIVSRGRARVAETRARFATQQEATARAERLERDAEQARSRGAKAAEAAKAALAGAGGPDGSMESVREIATASSLAAEAASERFETLLQEVTALNARIGSEKRDTALAELRLTEESLGERIATGMSEYAVMAMACRLMTLAEERFERLRKGPIVQCAEEALIAMTEGRYRRISVPLGKDAIEVFSASSAAIAPDDLSRGTAEQLYLALRIGLIEQSGTVGADLPVLMDDVLVNFSPARAEQAARAIADLSTRHQVVFFTCHPGTAEMLCAAAPDAVRLELAPPA